MARYEALKKEHRRWNIRKAQQLRQYSRRKNLVEKDNNTKYFHAYGTTSKMQKKIHKIKIGNYILSRKDEIRGGLRAHFRDSFVQELIPKVTLSLGSFAMLGKLTSQYLDTILDDLEIKAAVWDCNSHKTPGYDGFDFKFIKRNWDIIGNELIRSVLNFFTSGHFDHVINTMGYTHS